MKKKVKYPRRWHVFGGCGGWDEYHVWCVSKQQALAEANPYVILYGEAFLTDTKTGRIWRIKKLDNLSYVEKQAKKRKLV